MQSDVIEVRRDGRRRVRKSYSEAYKRRVVSLTWAPGVSVAQIAQRHELNANLLFTWRRQVGRAEAPGSSPIEAMPALLPVIVPLTSVDRLFAPTARSWLMIRNMPAPSSEPHGSQTKRLQAHINEQEVHRGSF